MKKINRLLWIACLAPLLGGCASTQVTRLDVGEVKDISGRWNDTDSRLVAEEMMNDCLGRPWIANAKTATGTVPTVIVGAVANNSDEHIATDVFVENLQRELINSGQVSFVANKDERGQVRDERADQAVNSTEDSRKAHGQEAGADFMLSGAINTIKDQEGGKQVVLYQVNLKLLDVKSNRIVWNGQKQIKKFVSRSKSSW